MFTSRSTVSVIFFIIITAVWANFYMRHALAPASKTAEVQTSKELIVFDRSHNLDFHTLVKTGDPSPDGNGEIFAQIKNVKREVLKDYENKSEGPYICHNGAGPDFTSLLNKDGKLFSITQLECSIGGAYLSNISQNESGELKIDGFHWMDFSSVGGTAVGCAGSVTPWQTHLGSEEYENDMAKASLKDRSIAGAHRYLGMSPSTSSIQKLGYNLGWVTQIVPPDMMGKSTVTKHYAMGRFSHELAYVMPDEKTVYLSDDSTNGAFFMFIADAKRDFSAGTLYAAKWKQSNQTDTLAVLEWISLGHATEAQIKSYLQDAPAFTKLFDKRACTKGCPVGFGAVNTGKIGPECLRVKPGQELIASRLESRRYAALKGATTEFNKAEGITFNAQTRELYLSISVLSSGMEDQKKRDKKDTRYDKGGSNAIKLPYNPCGMILKLSVDDETSLNSQFVVSKVSKLIEGVPKTYTSVSSNRYNSCDVTKLANPDNISMLENSPYLAIGEDSKGHEIDRLWLYNTQTQTLQEIAKAPKGAEFTSTYWYRNIKGYSYLMSVIQHPFGEEDWLKDHTKEKVPPQAKRSTIGYFGPFQF